MDKSIASIDISTDLSLLRLVEEITQSGEPRLLRRANEDVAILIPVMPSPRRRKTRVKSKEDYEAFLASAGAWADLDLERFLKENEERRETSSRPPVEL